MNGKTRRLTISLSAMLVLCLFSPRQSAFAQSPNNCIKVSATFTDVYSGGCCTYGTITQGGLLNGTTVTNFTPGAAVTPDPNTVSFIGELIIRTSQGELKTGNVYLYNFLTGQGTAIGLINSNTSTGRFAGARGTLFFNETKTVGSFPFTYQYDVTGEICFAQ